MVAFKSQEFQPYLLEIISPKEVQIDSIFLQFNY